MAYEWLGPGTGHSLLPVHRILLVEHGIHIIENVDMERLAADRVYEFLFVCLPLKLVGGTGSPVRPIAVELR
jgi:kynurenine formamidase